MGMAAGLSAIFRSPIGTAIFAVEVLYGGMDFEAGALIYCMLSAIVAYAVNGWFVGWQSLFQFPAHFSAAGVARLRLVHCSRRCEWPSRYDFAGSFLSFSRCVCSFTHTRLD